MDGALGGWGDAARLRFGLDGVCRCIGHEYVRHEYVERQREHGWCHVYQYVSDEWHAEHWWCHVYRYVSCRSRGGGAR